MNSSSLRLWSWLLSSPLMRSSASDTICERGEGGEGVRKDGGGGE